MSKQVEFFDSISELEKFLETSKLKHVNKALRIEKISSISKLFFYLGIPGVILFIISIFILNARIFFWIYALVIIIFMGFIFTKPGKKFNFIFIIGIFALLAFIPSIYGQSVLNILVVVPGGGGGGTLSEMEIHIANLTQILEPIEGYLKDEYAIARPVVFKEDGAYIMWFTFRGGMNKYRVGTARSEDGIKWDRSPIELGIDLSKNGWDSEMICYASPLEHEGKLYALYNGNNYGETGIGIAVWEDE